MKIPPSNCSESWSRCQFSKSLITRKEPRKTFKNARTKVMGMLSPDITCEFQQDSKDPINTSKWARIIWNNYHAAILSRAKANQRPEEWITIYFCYLTNFGPKTHQVFKYCQQFFCWPADHNIQRAGLTLFHMGILNLPTNTSSSEQYCSDWGLIRPWPHVQLS